MHPVLFDLPGALDVRTYGFAIILGLLLAIPWLRKWAVEEKLDPEIAYDLVLIALFGGVAGGRLEYVRANWHQYAHDLGQIFALRDGGLAVWGSILGAVAGGILYALIKRINPWTIFDMAAPVMAQGQVFGRLGCFAAGCCYGIPTDSPLGVTFTDPLTLAPIGVKVHPTQLYEAAYCAVLAALLIWMRPRRRFRGQLALTYLTLYPLLRSLNELIRGDASRGYVFEDLLGQHLSSAQFISIVVAAVAAVFWVRKLRAAKARAAKAS